MFNNNASSHPVAPIVLKGVRIIGKNSNFKGEYIPNRNAAGARNFSIELDPEQIDIQELIDLGWNIHFGKPNPEDPDYIPKAYLRVHVKYNPHDERNLDRFNPIISTINSAGTNEITEDTVSTLDDMTIIKANVTIRGRWKESNIYTGVVAYLSKMVARIEDEIDDDLSDMMEGLMDE